MRTILNIIRTSFIQKNWVVVIRKILAKFERDTSHEALVWASNACEEMDPFFNTLSADLWLEAKNTCSDLEKGAQNSFGTEAELMGGRANCEMLYFLTRFTQAKTVVETGVAAGWSSQAILTALQKNKSGKLFSSDFPYIRLDDPLKNIGVLVDENLKHRWSLDIRGDRIALPDIVKNDVMLDIFHYDSDKSYGGREFAFRLIEGRIKNNGYIIYDDIQDNMHFADLVAKNTFNYRVFKAHQKYVGLILPQFMDTANA